MENVQTLPFDKILSESAFKVWKLVDVLKFHMLFYKIITGKGLEFDRLREYVPGDDAKLIDWNSFARTGKVYVKVFKEERMLDSVFILDVSNTMTLGTTDRTKNEYASVLLTTLAYTSNLIGDKVGFVSFSNKIKKVVEPSLGVDTILQIAKILSEKNLYGGEKKWSVVTKTVLESFGEDSYVFFISDFISPDNYTFDFFSKAAAKFRNLLVIMLRDPLDSFIPKGIGYIYVSDPDTGEVNLINADKVRDEYNKRARAEEKLVEKKCKEVGADFIKIHTDEDFVMPLMKFLKTKRMLEWS